VLKTESDAHILLVSHGLTVASLRKERSVGRDKQSPLTCKENVAKKRKREQKVYTARGACCSFLEMFIWVRWQQNIMTESFEHGFLDIDGRKQE
jgi:hypothetical protein